jgi:phosphotransferase system enzyme I (PtsI)
MLYSGIGVSEGAVVGKIVTFRHRTPIVAKNPSRTTGPVDPEVELERFREGRKKTAAALEALAREAAEKFGEEKAGIFEGYSEILMDAEVEDAVRSLVGEGWDAEAAVREAMASLAADFAAMEGEYMRERAADMEDLGRRLADATAGREADTPPVLRGPCVLVADDLSPAETVRLAPSLIQALVVDRGGPTSHVAILARSLGVPCVVGLGSVSSVARDGDLCAVDGEAGIVVIDPDKKTIDDFRRLAADRAAVLARLGENASLPAVTADGVAVRVCANIGSAEEAKGARNNGADGAGLFRTEFLYMDGERLPSEDEQYATYTRTSELLGGAPLTIRTLDVGGDKDLPALGLTKEENPFLGYRAVRVGLDRPDILKPQLRAVLRTAALGPVELMFPLVVSVDELRRLKAVVAECRAELAAEGVATGPLPVGVMIETPAAALMARELAAEADFFSIGTNDLTQYTLAVDRGNTRIAALYDPFNPAVLRLIAAACDAARAAGIPVGMCGEFASDELAVPVLIGFGLNEFSVAASRVPAIKDLVRRLDSNSCQDLARRVLLLGSVAEVHAVIDTKAR